MTLPSFRLTQKNRSKFAKVERKTQFGKRSAEKLPSNDVDENKTKYLVKIIRREMDYFETVNIRGKYLGHAFEYSSTIQVSNQNALFQRLDYFVEKYFEFIASTFFKNTICDCQLMVE
jgi:hypothetical protein